MDIAKKININHKQPLSSSFISRFVDFQSMKMSSATFQMMTVVVLLCFVTECSSVLSESCQRRRSQLRIHQPNCIPKIIPAYACSGSCLSMTQPSRTLPGESEQFCRCCRHLDSRRLNVWLMCSNQNATGYIRTAFRVNVPQSCMCQPCQ